MTDRRLVLRTERLAELTMTELAVVVGGAQTTNSPDYTYYCLTGPAICDLTRIVCA